MDINISEEELTLLAYLHEHATGHLPSDPLADIPSQELTDALKVSDFDLRKQASYLSGFGLVGMRLLDPEIGFLTHVGITSPGENYMRQLEAELDKKQPGVFKKIGMKTVKASWSIIKPIAIKSLTDFVSSHVADLAHTVAKALH